MSIQLRANGIWVATIGGVGELKWSTLADGGLEQVSWRMPLPDTFSHPALRTGALVELFVGPESLGGAIMAEPNLSDEGWEFTAIGLHDELFSAYLALDSGGNTTSVPDTAIDQAIADGFPVTRPASLSADAFAEAETTDFLNYVGELLDAWAESASVRWRITPQRTIGAFADPMTPDWYLTPGAARVGVADDEYASDLYLRYRDSASTFATVHVQDAAASARRRKAVPVDLTSLGVITSGKADDVGEGMIAKGKARFAWTDAVNPSKYQLTTPGGTPAFLPAVRGGQMVRAFGVLNPQAPAARFYDFIIGRTEYEAGANIIQLTPVELATRKLGDVLSLAVA